MSIRTETSTLLLAALALLALLVVPALAQVEPSAETPILQKASWQTSSPIPASSSDPARIGAQPEESLSCYCSDLKSTPWYTGIDPVDCATAEDRAVAMATSAVYCWQGTLCSETVQITSCFFQSPGIAVSARVLYTCEVCFQTATTKSDE